MGSEVDNEQELQNFAIYSSSEDPYTYDEACKQQVWKDAMDAEIKAIEDNNTWE
ncbi:copia-type polyprotein, partial [Trifolium pratense]